MPPITSAELDAAIDTHLTDVTAIRHDLHAHPQLAFEETYANALVRWELTALGIEHVGEIATTGVVGWIDPPPGSSAASRSAVALRADMDALEIEEETGLPYASTHPGLMHACGHDGHTAVLLGAARVLHTMRDRLPRPVKLFFQPAEEGEAGAVKLIEQGALTREVGGHDVAAIFGLHGYPLAPIGQLHTRPGPIMAAADEVRITITGRGGHAAAPYQTVDPVIAAAHVVTALQTVVSRNTRPVDAAVVSITSVHAGKAFNVIPQTASLLGTIRTLNDRTAELVRRRVTEVAEQTAAALGCTADVEMLIGYPVLNNGSGATDYATAVARDVLGESNVVIMDDPLMGAEDFSYYANEVPAHFGFIGVRPHDRDSYPGLHHPLYDFSDAALPVGIRLMCRWALESGDL